MPFSAVLGSVGELREIVAAARDRLAFQGQRTIVFVDEIHRFNKAQQDAFLPHVEDGTIVLIGATTENPTFAVNAALLSRCKVFRLEPLGAGRPRHAACAARSTTRSMASARKNLSADDDALRAIAEAAGGDARRALSTLEIVADYLDDAGRATHVSLEAVAAAESHRPLLYDKAGEEHYNVVSAFIKSMRGSDPGRGRLLDDAHARGGRRSALRLAPHAHLRERGRRQRRPARAARRERGRRDAPPRGDARRASTRSRRRASTWRARPSRTRATWPGSAPRSSSRSTARSPVPMKLRNAVTPLMKEEGYGAGLQVRARLRGRRRPGRDVPARRARGRACSTSRPTAATRRASASGSPRSAADAQVSELAVTPSAARARPRARAAACASPFLRAASTPEREPRRARRRRGPSSRASARTSGTSAT